MNREIAETILQQIGGRKFIAMTGARDFAYDSKYASFKIGRNFKKINRVYIEYDEGQDLYNMIFKKINYKKLLDPRFETKDAIKTIESIDGVYCDQLEDIFQSTTGLATRLF